jgi:hypothetical protein
MASSATSTPLNRPPPFADNFRLWETIFLNLPRPPRLYKPTIGNRGSFLVAPLHGKTHVVLVPTFELPSYCVDAPSIGTFAGTGTLETSANFPPQPTILTQPRLHNFRRHCLRLHQPSLHIIQPPPSFHALPTGTHLPPFAALCPEPRDIQGQNPSNFNNMVSKGNKHDKGPRPSATEGIPEALGQTNKKSPPPSTRSHSPPQSQSALRSCSPKKTPKPTSTILEVLHSTAKDIMKALPKSFAQVAAWPPSPDVSKPTPIEAAIASATTALTTAV